MKKRFTLALIALTMIGAIAPTTVKAEDIKREATVKVNADPNGSLIFNSATPTIGFGDINLDKSGPTSSTFQKNDLAVSVLDSRGTGAGWNLSVRYADADGNSVTDENAWTDETKGSHLKGANLVLITEDAIVTHDGGRTFAQESTPSFSPSINVSGSDESFMNATTGTGLGEWTGTLSSEKDHQVVTLDVPSTTTLAGTYKANLLWTLTDAPK